MIMSSSRVTAFSYSDNRNLRMDNVGIIDGRKDRRDCEIYAALDG